MIFMSQFFLINYFVAFNSLFSLISLVYRISLIYLLSPKTVKFPKLLYTWESGILFPIFIFSILCVALISGNFVSVDRSGGVGEMKFKYLLFLYFSNFCDYLALLWARLWELRLFPLEFPFPFELGLRLSFSWNLTLMFILTLTSMLNPFKLNFLSSDIALDIFDLFWLFGDPWTFSNFNLVETGSALRAISENFFVNL